MPITLQDSGCVYIAYGAARELWGCRSEECLIEGPAGCVAPETIFDGQNKTIECLAENGIRPIVQTLSGPVLAEIPFWKGKSPLYRITTEQGRSILTTPDHKLLTERGWTFVSDLVPGMKLPSWSPSDAPPQDKTASVKYERSGDFYDIHVPGPQHYAAHGLWHHNTGKTRAILEKIHFCCMKYANTRALIVRKTRESMTNSVLVTLEQKVIPRGSEIMQGPARKLRQKYEYPNGSVIEIGGMDNATKIMSTEYDIIGTFESTELTEEDFESLTTRLRNGIMPYQQIIADCNPGSPHHWLNKRDRKSGMVRLLSRHEDNPVFFSPKTKSWTDAGRKYLEKLDRLTGARKMRLRFGKWAQAEGIVYEEFDRSIHVIPRRNLPQYWRRVRSIDFGYNNPFVCLWGAVSPDGDIYIYREIYRTKLTVAIHAKVIHSASRLKIDSRQGESEEEKYEATISDHDAEDRATLDNEGIETIPAYKAITPGIQAVKERLKKDDRDRPRIFFFEDMLWDLDQCLIDDGLPVSTLQEFDSYIWAKNAEGRPIKEEPVDRENHGMDALRYMIAYVDNISAIMLRVEGDEAVPVYVKG